jgi:3-phenylpropionate/trans-cinnamate dioxygenase ferredoxin subunit
MAMTQSTAEFVKVAKTSDLVPGKNMLVTVGDEYILLSNVDGEFYAISALCTHMGAMLPDGIVDGEEIMCPWHASRFKLKTGVVTPDAVSKVSVAQYLLQIKGEDIFVSPKPIDLPVAERKPLAATREAAATPEPAAKTAAPTAMPTPAPPTPAPIPTATPTAAPTPVSPTPAAAPTATSVSAAKMATPVEQVPSALSKARIALRDIIDGKFLGHPNHALLIHFPSALFPISLLFDFMSYFMDGTALTKAAFYLIAVGLAFSPLAMLTGFMDYFSMTPGSKQRQTATIHWIINTVSVSIMLISLALRLGNLDAAQSEWSWTAISFIGVSLIIVGNYFGAELIFHMGMRVSRGGPPAPVVVAVSKLWQRLRSKA